MTEKDDPANGAGSGGVGRFVRIDAEDDHADGNDPLRTPTVQHPALERTEQSALDTLQGERCCQGSRAPAELRTQYWNVCAVSLHQQAILK